jgi:cytochrome P450
MKRAPLNPYFSKASVSKLEPMIFSKVEKLCSRLTDIKGTDKPVNLRHAFAALTMDVVTEYSFGTSYDCLDDPDFAPIWPEAVDSISEQSHTNKQFPWLLPIMMMTPLWAVKRLNPHMMRLIDFRIVSRSKYP